MRFQFQILSIKNEEMSPAFMLSTENYRYLFNAGDGIQRLAMEHKIKLAKLQCIGLTQVNADTIGGLPGLILTLSDTGKTKMNLIGPGRTEHFLHATRHFLNRPHFQWQVHEISQGGLHAVSLATDDDDDDISSLKRKKKKDKPAPELNIHAIAFETSQSSSSSGLLKRKQIENPQDIKTSRLLNYICTCPAMAGKFRPEEALQRGVPKGPLFGQLKQGQDVVLDNGTTVRSQDCVEPGLGAQHVLVLDCPTDYSVEAWVQTWTKVLLTAKDLVECLVVHFTPSHVSSLSVYQEFIRTHLSSTGFTHVSLSCSNYSVSNSVYQASSKLQAQLASRFPSVFPSPPSGTGTGTGTGDHMRMNTSEETKLIMGRPLLSYHFHPAKHTGWDDCQCLNTGQKKDEDSSNSKIIQPLRPPPRPTNDQEPQEQRITFLGTGSAIPSKYRNVTSIHVQLDDQHGMLLDAGEGCVGQLWRCFGNEGRRRILETLSVVIISHFHADHHLGLLKLLRECRVQRPERPLTIIAPAQMRHWLEEYYIGDYYNGTDGTNSTPNYVFFDCQEFTTSGKCRDVVPGLRGFQAIRVDHCHLAYAFLCESQDGWTVGFSGDCRPSREFITAARGFTPQSLDLLIHEATFENELELEAKKKKHSTMNEAIQVGVSMNAKIIILTHFSQRYPKLPQMHDDGEVENQDQSKDLLKQAKVIFAFDCMSILSWELDWIATKVMAPLAQAFEQLDEEK